MRSKIFVGSLVSPPCNALFAGALLRAGFLGALFHTSGMNSFRSKHNGAVVAEVRRAVVRFFVRGALYARGFCLLAAAETIVWICTAFLGDLGRRLAVIFLVMLE